MKNFIFFNLLFLLSNTYSVVAQWEQVNNDYNAEISSFITHSDTLYVSTTSGGIFYTANFGNTWNQISIPDLHIYSLDVVGRTIVAGSNEGIYYSSNFGVDWTLINYTEYHNFIAQVLIIYNHRIIAGTHGRGIYSTIDLGANWENTRTDPSYTHIETFLKSYNNILTAIHEQGVYASNDGGLTWLSANIGLTDLYAKCFAKNNSIIYLGTNNGSGLFCSFDSSKSWTTPEFQWGLSDNYLISLDAMNTVLFAATDFRIFYTQDNGNNWHLVNTNSIPGPPIHESQFKCIKIFGDYLFAGTSHGIWRCPLSLTTSIQNNNELDYSSIKLYPNYPNPFNPSTKISWQSSVGSWQSLKVYDVLGREVATLVDEYRNAASYEVEFNANSLPSGVYFYQLKAGNFVQTKKMILIK